MNTFNEFYITPELKPLFAKHDVFDLEGEEHSKMDGRKTIRIEFAGQAYFIKTHRGIGWKEIFKNLTQLKLPVLGAKPELRAIECLQKIGIDTITIVGFGKRGLNPARMKSFIATRALENTTHLFDFTANWQYSTPPFKLKKQLIIKVADIARTMHRHGFNHRDFHLGHLLLHNNNLDHMRISVIDLHRSQVRKKTPRRWAIKDLASLYDSCLKINWTQRDLLRFMKHYSGTNLKTTYNKDLRFWQQVDKKAKALYAKKNPLAE